MAVLPHAGFGQDRTRTPPEASTRIDDSISYLYGPLYKTPFITTPNMPGGANIARNIFEIIHRDSQGWGGNFLDMYVRKSSGVEPAADAGTGALELYAVERTNVSLRKIVGSWVQKTKILRDVSAEAGLNVNTKNSQFAPEERTLYVGPAAQVKLPRGILNVAVHYRKEWNHEGILNEDEHYNADFNFEMAWSIPVTLAKRRIDWSGFDTEISPKGVSTLGFQTKTETLFRTQAASDLGELFGHKHLGTDLGVGLEYWHNEYGVPAATFPGADELTPVFMITVHLPHGGTRSEPRP